MRKIIIKKHKHTVSRIKELFVFLEIKFRFHDVNSKDNLVATEENWLRFYELASSYVAPVELVDIDDGASSYFDSPDSPIEDTRCYGALFGALIQCFQIRIVNDEEAYCGILDGVDKLNSAWYKLGKAELYAEMEIESADNSARGKARADARHKDNRANKELITTKLKEAIVTKLPSMGKISRPDFLDKVVGEIYSFSKNNGMEYKEDGFHDYLLKLMSADKDLSALFREYCSK